MATVQVIIAGHVHSTVHDTWDYPLILQFGASRDYSKAEWVIPSFGPHIPASRLSEIRVQNGSISVLIDGPEGFRSGPYAASWVRSQYPRGKHCSFLQVDAESHTMTGVSITTFDETLFVDEFSTGSPGVANA